MTTPPIILLRAALLAFVVGLALAGCMLASASVINLAWDVPVNVNGIVEYNYTDIKNPENITTLSLGSSIFQYYPHTLVWSNSNMMAENTTVYVSQDLKNWYVITNVISPPQSETSVVLSLTNQIAFFRVAFD